MGHYDFNRDGMGQEHTFNNKNKILTIAINSEHTLVKEGGRDVPKNTPKGIIEYNKDKKYFVRIEKFQKLNLYDIIIDYSIPNIYNVSESGLFNDFSRKHIYISPCIYEYIYINSNDRNIKTLTTFIDTNQPRRKILLDNIKAKNLEHRNVNNCFNKIKLRELYKNTKVIINIRQTDHHDTFEELRCLPGFTKWRFSSI